MGKRARRVLIGGLLAALGVVALPSVAAACPACAGRTGDDSGHGRAVVIGAFVLMPWGIAWGVSRIVKRGEAIDARVGKPPAGDGDAES